MIGSRAWRALMRRNVIYRGRNIIGTLFEVCLPIIFVAFLVLIKGSVENSESFAPEEKDAFFPTDADALIPFTFSDYVTSMQAPRVCQELPDVPPDIGIPFESDSDGETFQISGIPGQGYNWQVPFVKCDSRLCREAGEDAQPYCEYLALGVAPLNQNDEVGKQQASNFRTYVNDRFPQLLASSNATPYIDFDVVQYFDSDQAVEEYVQAPEYQNPDVPKLALAVVFDGTDSSTSYNYRIRLNSTNFNAPEAIGRPATTTTPPTDRILNPFATDDFDSCPSEVGGTPFLGTYDSSCTGRYFYNGAIAIQRLVGDFIFVDTGARDAGYWVGAHGTVFASFPSPAFVINGFYAQIAGFAPLLITLGLLYPVAAMVRYLVLEKELRQKELMKMMSVKESDIGWSWFISFFCLHIITSIGTTIMSVLLYENSSTGLLFFFWLFTFMAIITFTMFLGALFSRATRATLVTLLVFFVGYFLTLIVSIEDGNTGTIALISLHPVGAFAYGLQEIGRLEDLGVGLNADTINTTDSPSGYTFSNTLQNLFFDCIFWGIICWYTNRVSRSEFGRPLPWYFPCTVSYWCPGMVKPPPSDDENDKVTYDEGIPVEPVSDTLKQQAADGKSIEIHNLRKVFGEKTAVDGLSLSMYNGQITALLGHNGAGKTTTISMLTGMLEPTEGYATVNGRDIRTDMENIRGDIGICLQHDCLFPQLTVLEHVDFFSRIKGLYSKMSSTEAKENIIRCVADVALAEKSNTLSKNLSGGMKRKLSLAIAFCGDSKTVLLDEPTSGMDPFSRRFTWNVIRQYRQDRCIILTTHFMDEADILGDRIAIMSEGQLRCLGSSLFLKKTYGVGYQLTIEKLPSSQTAPIDDDKLAKNDDDRLTEIVTRSVEEATLLTNVGTEISFQLPIGAASNFAPMFEQLDAEVEQKHIVTYGVGITTLDEVFLLVARGDTHDEHDDYECSHRPGDNGDAPNVTAKDEDRSARSRMDLDQEGLFSRHIVALFRKRAMNFKRDKKAWCCTTILPSIFVLIGFLLTTISSGNRELEPLLLTLEDLNPETNAEPRNPISFSIADEFTCQPGTCVYEFPVIFDPSNPNPDEIYYYCGGQSYLGNDTSCTIEEYESIMNRITEAGAEAVGGDYEDINASSYGLAETMEDFEAIQYGAVFFTHDLNSTIYGATLGGGFGSDFTTNTTSGQNFTELIINTCLERKSDFVTEEECFNSAGIGYVIQYNYTAIHVSPLFQTLADEAIVREALNDDDFTIKTTIDPLPFTDFESGVGGADDAFNAWFLIILGFPFITGSFATFVVAERESKAKHLQTVAGVRPSAYWFSTWLWDVANYQIPLWITVALMFIFDIEVLTNTENGALGGTIVLLILFGPAAASFTYCVTFLFTSPSVCNMFVIIFGFLIGMGGTLASFIMRLIGSDTANPNDSLVLAADIVTWVCRFIPAFNLSNGLFSVINIDSLNFVAGRELTAWDKEVMFYEIIFLAWESVVYLFLAMKIDEWSNNPRAVSIWRSFVNIITCQCFCSSTYTVNEESAETPDDDDVLAEKERISNGEANDDLIVLDKLTKVYDNGKVAVNNMSLGIAPGQCFGLLGINGAGKTTTMAMLTAEFPPTSGDATLAGFSVTNEPEKTRRRVGYCPQFDAHFANLTGREHIELYASIKGVPVDLVKEASASKLSEVGLNDFDSDRLSAGYSGGMKRRLSLACATIGQPQIVFLDECSTGVDPVARREIWKMISDMVSGGNVPPAERTSVILTTHSMEECEALCPRIGIMAGGKMRCLGSAQRLKSKFGQGFQLEMKVKNVDQSDEDYLKNLKAIAAAAEVAIPEQTEVAEEGAPEGTVHIDDVFLDMNQTMLALSSLTGDEFLTSLIGDQDPAGFLIYKDASSPTGIDVDSLTSFATAELRMRDLQDFIAQDYPKSVLRERQDTKVRYEVSSDGVRISNIFASIEEKKESLLVAEYGVSQTSLEQVFNMHAAEAEKLKQGTNDA